MKIDGNAIAETILEKLKIEISWLAQKGEIPHLVIALVGDDPASIAYVRRKEIKAKSIGIQPTIVKLDSRITTQELLKTIERYNHDDLVSGIIVQRPLPLHIDNERVNLAVNPKKDIDGFHPKTKFIMPLAAAVLLILEHVYSSIHHYKKIVDKKSFKLWLSDKKIVVIGKGQTGGGPTIELLKKMNINPAIIDSRTKNPKEIIKNADIVITAVGKKGVLRKNMFKQDVILIGVGMHRGEDGRLHGDYEENDIKNIASYYTPIPGGVGPVNVAMLLANLVSAAKTQKK